MKIQLRNSLALALSALMLNSVAAQPASAGSFSLVGPMSQFRRLHTATLLSNGKVLVAGGSPFAQAATSEIYEPTAQIWTNSGALNTGRELHTATPLADGSVMLAGGQSANRILTSTEICDAASGMWTNTGVLNVARIISHRQAFDRRAQRYRSAGERGAVRSADRTLDTDGLHVRSSRGTHRFAAAEWQSAGHRRRWFRISPDHYQFTDVTADSSQRFYRGPLALSS